MDASREMEREYCVGLVITLVLGIFVLVGAAIAGLTRKGNAVVEFSIAIAFGAMVMLLVAELIPEVLEESLELGIPLIIVAIFLGMVILRVIDRFLPDHHHHHDEQGHEEPDSVLHIGIATAIALIVHNVVEGMGVYSVSVESLSTALLLGLGIGIHNIPMGMIVYSGIAHQKTSRKVLILALASLSTFVGGVIMAAMSSAVDERVMGFMVCMTIGLLLYIVVFELIPHLYHAKRKGLVAIGIVAGIAAVLVSVLLETLA